MGKVLLKILIFFFFTTASTFGVTPKQNCRSYVEWDNVRHCLLEIDREYQVPVDTKSNHSQTQSEDSSSDEVIIMQSDRDGPPPGLIIEDTPEE